MARPLIINAPEVTFQDRTTQEAAYAARLANQAITANARKAQSGINMTLWTRVKAWLNSEAF